MKNKLFFFGRGKASTRGRQQQFFFNVPPDALRAGDFSQAFNSDGTLQVIYDPLTGNPDGTGRLPFPGNVIPADRISDIAQTDSGLYPRPNLAGQLSSGNVGGAAISHNYHARCSRASSIATTTTSRSTTTPRRRRRSGASTRG